MDLPFGGGKNTLPVMKFPRLVAFLFSGLPWLCVSGAKAENWPRFRGPNGSGLAAGVSIPAEWADADYRFRVDLPGIGHGSPVVWGDRLFLLAAGETATAKSQTWMPLCLSTQDGSVIWKHEIAEGGFKGHRFNSPASTTPAVDEKRVVFTWGTKEKLTMVAFSHSGEKLWESDLGPVNGGHGFAASPMLLGDLVILNNDQEKRAGNLLAVHADTGKVAWTVERRSERISYSVPCVFEANGRPLLMFTNWQHGFTAIDPKDGSVVAELSVFNTDTNERAISSPVVYRDLVIGTCGFTANPKHCVAVKMNEENELEEVWRVERNAPHIPSVIVVGDRCFLWDDAGIVTCVAAATGEEIWKGRVPGIEGPCMGSPVSDGARIYCADESGNVHVIAADMELRVLGKNALGDLCRSTPAFGDGALFVRTHGKLFAVSSSRQNAQLFR